LSYLKKATNRECLKKQRFDNLHSYDPNYVLIKNFSQEELDEIKKDPITYVKDKQLLKSLYIFLLPDKKFS